MKLTPEINFTFEFTDDEITLLLNAIKKESILYSSRDDEWETSPLRQFYKLLRESAYGDSAITLTLNEAKELALDISDTNNFCSEFKELWSTLWNTLKSY